MNWKSTFCLEMGKCSGYYRCQNLNFVKKWDIAPLCCQTSICLLYIVMESDLKTLSAINILFKYADDTNLLVPEKNWCTSVGRIWKYSPILRLSTLTKQRKLYFIGLLLDIPYLFRYIIGIEQVLSAKLLGVTFCSNLKFDDHIKTFWLSVVNAVIYSGVL